MLLLTKFSGDLNTDTATLNVQAHLSILFGGPIANGCGLAGTYGTATITTSPFQFTTAGNVEPPCIQAGTLPGGYLHIDGNGYFTEGLYANYDFGDFGYVQGNVAGTGYLDPNDGQYHARLDGHIKAHTRVTEAFGLGTRQSAPMR